MDYGQNVITVQTCIIPSNHTVITITNVNLLYIIYIYIYLIQNSQAVKKMCGPQKGYANRCEIQGGDQEMAVMVG